MVMGREQGERPTSPDRWGFCEWWPIQGAQQSRGISLFDQTSEKGLLGGCRAESMEDLILGAAKGLNFIRDGVPTRTPTFSHTYLAYLGMVEAAHAALMLSLKLPPKSLAEQLLLPTRFIVLGPGNIKELPDM